MLDKVKNILDPFVGYVEQAARRYRHVSSDATFEGATIDVNEYGRIMFPVKAKFLFYGDLLTETISEEEVNKMIDHYDGEQNGQG